MFLVATKCTIKWRFSTCVRLNCFVLTVLYYTFKVLTNRSTAFPTETLRLMFQAYTLVPWIDCFGHWIRLRRAALNNIENFVSHMNSEAHHYTQNYSPLQGWKC